MNRFEQFCDEAMDFFELKLKSIKDKMKRYEEMNACALSGGAAKQKLDDEEAGEQAAAARAAAYREEEDDDDNPKDAQAQFLIDGWEEKEEEIENVKPFVRVIKGEMCVFCDIDNYLSVLDFDQHHPRMEEAYVLRHLSKEAAKKKRGVVRRIHVGYYCRECDKIIHKDEYPKLKEGQTKLVIEKMEKEWIRNK